MKQYRLDYTDLEQTTLELVECVKYDYTPLENRYINVAELLDYLNSVQSLNDVTFLIHNLTKPIPGSD